MNTIQSFQINHDKLKPGIYVSRKDAGITTYDLRFKVPNQTFLSTASAHTIEHLFATYARDRFPDHIVYFGPMGCRTGFYLLTAGLEDTHVITLVQDAIRFIMEYEGRIPGDTPMECGNYQDHDLVQAKKDASDYFSFISKYQEEDLRYIV